MDLLLSSTALIDQAPNIPASLSPHHTGVNIQNSILTHPGDSALIILEKIPRWTADILDNREDQRILLGTLLLSLTSHLCESGASEKMSHWY